MAIYGKSIARRKFIATLGRAAFALSFAARAQQPALRIGVLMSSGGPNDEVARARLAAFLDGLQQLGWTDGSNVRKCYQ